MQALLAASGSPVAQGLSPAFRYLLSYDTHGNVVLLIVAVAAFALRHRPAAFEVVQSCTARPWLLAAAIFPLLCLGALRAYHDYPLSMDEYSALFQARAFAAGRISGTFPPELLDRLIPVFLQNHFLSVARATGELSSTYWPAFALLLAPFVWLDVSWAANPALGALVVPALHRLTKHVTGSSEAAGWAVAFTVASPAFIVASISYYSLQAHLLFNVLYALLLVRASVPRALLAGLVGSIALTLHNPIPHLLFCTAFIFWIAIRGGGARVILALALGYTPLSLLLGFGWHQHLAQLMGVTAQAPGAAAVSPGAAMQAAGSALMNVISFPGWETLYARLLGLSKIWTWGALGLLVIAAYGYGALRAAQFARVLAAALGVTFFGYFLVRFDQGHGWGYRYVHSAWFVLPLLAGACLAAASGGARSDLRGMAAWGIVLSLLLANGLRLIQIETFITRHQAQVPPLARPADPRRPEVLFIDITRGFYTHDMVQNDPFLRAPRITMVHERGTAQPELMARRFPAYVKSAEGDWGELWSAPGNR